PGAARARPGRDGARPVRGHRGLGRRPRGRLRLVVRPQAAPGLAGRRASPELSPPTAPVHHPGISIPNRPPVPPLSPPPSPSWHASGMASQAAAGATATRAVAVVVGEEELLVERAVARLVAAASGATGQGGQEGGDGPLLAETGVREVAAGALSPGELAS